MIRFSGNWLIILKIYFDINIFMNRSIFISIFCRFDPWPWVLGGVANVENEDGVLVVLNEDIQKIKTLLPELREEERKRKNQEEIEKAESLRRRKEGPAVKEARATNERESRGEERNNYFKTSAVRNKKTFESHHRKLTILSTIFYYTMTLMTSGTYC